MALLEVRGLHKSYSGGPLGKTELPVLRGVDMTLQPGDRVSIVGASGAGKSTLLHIVGALDVPSKGQVIFEGQDIFSQPEKRIAAYRNTSVGFVFQFHHLLPDFTAIENVMMPAMILHRGRAPAELRKRADELLEGVGLRERRTHRPGELSGGEQQRVAVARALILRPRLLLADEPTGNLDGPTGRAVEESMLELAERYGSATIVVTHNPVLAAHMPMQLRMADGRIQDDAPEAQSSDAVDTAEVPSD